ncbi:MAG: hypothetical protein HW416_1461 [Chloroflexi bacterium]|nr:hypothetical protein [Chloroflexota bacterium]
MVRDYGSIDDMETMAISKLTWFLAATADVYDLTLVTADKRLLSGKGFRTLANH